MSKSHTSPLHALGGSCVIIWSEFLICSCFSGHPVHTLWPLQCSQLNFQLYFSSPEAFSGLRSQLCSRVGQVRRDKELTPPGSSPQPVVDGRWCINTSVPSLLRWDNSEDIPVTGCLVFPVSHPYSFTHTSLTSFTLRYYLYLDPFFRVCSWGNLNSRTLVLDTRGSTGGNATIHSTKISRRSMSESQNGPCFQMLTFLGRDLDTLKFSVMRGYERSLLSGLLWEVNNVYKISSGSLRFNKHSLLCFLLSARLWAGPAEMQRWIRYILYPWGTHCVLEGMEAGKVISTLCDV